MALESIEALAFQAQILDQVHDSVIATNLEGRITFWNSGAERLFGYNADEAVGQHISFVYPAEAHANLNVRRLASLLERGFQENSATVRTKAGRSLTIYARLSLLRDEAKVPTGILSFAIDTTDLQQARADLQDRERQLRTILDTIPGVVVHLDSKLRIKFANKTFETMANCPCVDLIGRDIRHALPYGNPIAAQMPRIVEELSGSAATYEVEFVSESGQQRWMAVLQIPDVGMQGEVQGCFIVGNDVTETKRIQTVILNEERRLRETLISEVHHRVKNSLQGIVGLLRAQAMKRPDLTTALAPAIAQVLSISVGFGLTSTRSERGIVLCDMVQEICRCVEQVTGAKIATQFDEAILSAPVVVHRKHGVNLGMIVNELVFNAVKHGKANPGNPRVTVALSRTAEISRVRISNYVESTSTGINYPTGAGHGSGLSLVRALLPSRGSDLSFAASDGQVVAVLELEFNALGIANADPQEAVSNFRGQQP